MNYDDIPSLNNIELPSLGNNCIDGIPNISSYYNNHQDEISRALEQTQHERLNREVENNDSLKNLVKTTEEICEYNKNLVSFNEKILNKINSLDETLSFLNTSFNKDIENSQQQTALLLQLITIIDDKDSSKLKEFITGLPGVVVSELIISYFKIKLGLTV